MATTREFDRVQRVLDAVYREPDACNTFEDFTRETHQDIPARTLDEIDAECILARLRWAVLVHRREEPSRWLLDRLALLDDAARARRPRQ